MNPYIPGEQPRQPGLVKLNTNENPFPPSPAALALLGNICPESLQRYPPPMADDLALAAAETLQLPADAILPTNGGDELLDILFRAVIDPGQTVCTAEPSYSLYHTLIAAADARHSPIPYQPDWSIDPHHIARHQPRLTLITRPNAPSGTCLPLATIEHLADLLEPAAGLLLIDEAYADFAADHCAAMPLRRPNVVILRSLSKGYSLAGLRVGFGIMNPALKLQLAKVKASYNLDALAQRIAAAALRDQPYFQQCRAAVINLRQHLAADLASLHFRFPPSHANFLWVRPPGEDGSGFAARGLVQHLRHDGLLVRYWDSPELRSNIRITVGTAEQNQRLIDSIRRWLNPPADRPTGPRSPT